MCQSNSAGFTYCIAKEVGSGKSNGYYPAVVAQVGRFYCVVIIGDAHRAAAISSCSGAQPLGDAGSSVFAIYYQRCWCCKGRRSSIIYCYGYYSTRTFAAVAIYIYHITRYRCFGSYVCIDSRYRAGSGSRSGIVPLQGVPCQWRYISSKRYYCAGSGRAKGNRSTYRRGRGRSVEQVYNEWCFLTWAFTCSLQRIEIRVTCIYICIICLQVPLSTNTYKYSYIATCYYVLKIRYFRRFAWHSAHHKSLGSSGSNIGVLNKHQRCFDTAALACILGTKVKCRIPIYKSNCSE